jgi:hypothetical protein
VALGLEGDWRAHRDSGEPLGPLVAAYHPSARVSRERMGRPWEVLALAEAELGIEDVRARRAQEGSGQR